jgi:DNA-binding MarR family transcriptional regulator
MKRDKEERGPEAMVGFWVNRASRAIVRHTDLRLRPHGFALGYLPVLRALAEASPLSQRELAEVARVEQPTMVETLARMERDGLIQRETNPSDLRAKLVSLTRTSRTRFPKAVAELADAERLATAGFSQAEREALRGLLERVVANIEGADDSDAHPRRGSR